MPGKAHFTLVIITQEKAAAEYERKKVKYPSKNAGEKD